MDTAFIEILKIIIATSIFFVWVVRYENIVKEFKSYKLSNSVRDLVGILKLSFSVMLISTNQKLVFFGATGILLLMLGAQVVHFRFKTSLAARVPSLVLIVLSGLIIAANLS